MTTSKTPAFSLRLEDDTLKELGTIAAFQERTVASLIRLALKEYIQNQQRRAYPLTIPVALALGEALELGPQRLVEQSFYLGEVPSKFAFTPAVYALIHQDTNEVYVGSTNDLSRRCVEHSTRMEAGSHKNKSIKNWSPAWTVVVVLDTVESEDSDKLLDTLRRREQAAIDAVKEAKLGTLVNTSTAHNLVSEHKARPQRQQTLESSRASLNLSTTQTQQGELDASKPIFHNENIEYVVKTAYVPGQGKEAFNELFLKPVVLPILQTTEDPAEMNIALETANGYGEDENKWMVDFVMSNDNYYEWFEIACIRGRFPSLSHLFL